MPLSGRNGIVKREESGSRVQSGELDAENIVNHVKQYRQSQEAGCKRGAVTPATGGPRPAKCTNSTKDHGTALRRARYKTNETSREIIIHTLTTRGTRPNQCGDGVREGVNRQRRTV